MAAAVVVLCTAPARTDAPGKQAAAELARTLVAERLCACVNLLPGVTSVFRWEGRIDTADEVLLIAKTTTDRVGELRARIAGLHPYQVPEVIELAVNGGLPAFLQWLGAAVARE